MAEETVVLDAEGKPVVPIVPDTKGKIKFDADQMLMVNDLYSEAFRKGAEKAETDSKAKYDALVAEKTAADTKHAADLAAAAAKAPVEDKDKPNPEFEQMKAQMTEMRGIFDATKAERDKLLDEVKVAKKERAKSNKKDAFLSGVRDAKVNFFDASEAYKLAEDDGYEYDEAADKPFIKNKATGVAKLNENGEPMSVIDFVKDFAKRKNYLVQAGVPGGTGSSQSSHQVPKEEPTVNYATMSNEEFAKIQQDVALKAAQRK